MTHTDLPDTLAEIRDDFLELGLQERLQLLLEFSNELPALPDRYENHPDLFERVVECQSPVFIFVEVSDDRRVSFFATAPPEAPTTRGFASIIQQGVDGLTVDQVLSIPDDYPQSLGLAEAVSPLRVRGMAALLARTKHQVSARAAS